MTIRLSLQHHEGTLATMDVGEWSLLAERACVYLRCPDCGGTYDIPVADIRPSGDVVSEFICQTPSCSLVRRLALMDWKPPVFDTSDVKSSR